MESLLGRSSGVEEAIAGPLPQARADAQADADAEFEALYRGCRDEVFAYAAGLLRDRAAAEDVTALAFERAYRRRRSFNPKRGSRRAWLFGIARNAALDELRRRQRGAALAAEPVDQEGVDVGEAAEVAIRRAALRRAIGALGPRDRELVALKFFAGLSNAEIARVIGVSETNAGTRLHRVVEKLRRSCDEAA